MSCFLFFESPKPATLEMSKYIARSHFQIVIVAPSGVLHYHRVNTKPRTLALGPLGYAFVEEIYRART